MWLVTLCVLTYSNSINKTSIHKQVQEWLLVSLNSYHPVKSLTTTLFLV